jgi:hypothetical protein
MYIVSGKEELKIVTLMKKSQMWIIFVLWVAFTIVLHLVLAVEIVLLKMCIQSEDNVYEYWVVTVPFHFRIVLYCLLQSDHLFPPCSNYRNLYNCYPWREQMDKWRNITGRGWKWRMERYCLGNGGINEKMVLKLDHSK